MRKLIAPYYLPDSDDKLMPVGLFFTGIATKGNVRQIFSEKSWQKTLKRSRTILFFELSIGLYSYFMFPMRSPCGRRQNLCEEMSLPFCPGSANGQLGYACHEQKSESSALSYILNKMEVSIPIQLNSKNLLGQLGVGPFQEFGKNTVSLSPSAFTYQVVWHMAEKGLESIAPGQGKDLIVSFLGLRVVSSLLKTRYAYASCSILHSTKQNTLF